MGYHNFTDIPTVELPVKIIGLGTKFVPTPRFNPEVVRTEATRFKRLVWIKAHFENSENNDFVPRFHAKSNSLWMPRACDVPPEIQFYCDQVLVKISESLSRPMPICRPNYDRVELRRLKDLILEKDIVIKPSDKNLGLAILKGSWYRDECLRQLSDTDFYLPDRVTTDARGCWDIERAYVSFIRSIDLSGIPEQQFKFLYKDVSPLLQPDATRRRNRLGATIVPPEYQCRWKFPEFYIIPKIHKTPIKGRPLVPSHSYITCPMSVFVDFHLQGLIKLDHPGNFILKDSKSFVAELSKLRFDRPGGIVMFTGDVSSLYTNIPMSGLNDFSRYVSRFPDVIAPELSLILVSMLSFIMTYNHFTWQDRVYTQNQGVAMGTPCAPSYANLYLQALETDLFENRLNASTRPLYYKRYIDDIFVILPDDPDIIAEFFDQHAQAYGNLEVTWSSDYPLDPKRNEIEFLDTVVFKDANFMFTKQLSFRVHQKVLNRYLYIPYKSCHPKDVLKSWIKTELIRYIRNSSCEAYFLEIQARFAARLRARGYPPSFLRFALKQVQYSDRARLLAPSDSTKSNVKAPLVFKQVWHPNVPTLTLGQSLTLTDLIRDRPMFGGRRPIIAYQRANNIGDLINTWFRRRRITPNPSSSTGMNPIVISSDDDVRPETQTRRPARKRIRQRTTIPNRAVPVDRPASVPEPAVIDLTSD